ncbi:MAG: nucleoside-diphosphate sugar epimerase/dehydratase, partial [Pseudomonadota bacterium]|nr:nucleoside-diphosphate sugar epimerase/dehydratase [Pseudomonadota bacterium]
HGEVRIDDLRPLSIEDLLSRPPVPPEVERLSARISDRVVMVTGAGGSIGSELTRQVLALGPRRLLLVESSEYALYSIHRELESLGVEGCELVPLLASVVDRERMARIFETWSPHQVYQAAAYKHVPLVEHNVLEGIRNNALGTLVIAELAMEQGVENFVLVSTDKAVRPSNTMGASKRLAELILQGLATRESRTCFSMVRFGNVLGSSGSVVPLFREQIRHGGPVTITHMEMTRYFMTIPEAAQLVMQAGAMARGGEVFVLDMGQPVRILDLARNMIELSGLTVRDEDGNGEIEIRAVGLRPGEKLYEELLIGNNPEPTDHPRIMMAQEKSLPWPELRKRLDLMAWHIQRQDTVASRHLLQSLVEEFAPTDGLVDWTHLAADLRLDEKVA